MTQLNTRYFEDVSVGMRETFSKRVTSADVVGFADISGDHNPIHLDDAYAATTPFGCRIAHGILTASHISAAIATRLPGPGAIYIAQTLRFLAPVKIDDTVDTTVEIVELIEKGRRAKLKCVCAVGDTIVLEGEAEVKIPGRPKA
ncbi:MAG: MaoC family dehydratase [Hyphomonadaceae bacterium]